MMHILLVSMLISRLLQDYKFNEVVWEVQFQIKVVMGKTTFILNKFIHVVLYEVMPRYMTSI